MLIGRYHANMETFSFCNGIYEALQRRVGSVTVHFACNSVATSDN